MLVTKVKFSTSDSLLQKLMDSAEVKCEQNIRMFGDKPVLVEGGGYEKIWLETQPMGGAMYAKRNLEAALNNQLLFMHHQRPDGRLPGSITVIDDKVVPQFNKFQGFCFPAPALDMYYLTGRNPEYLQLLYKTLEDFDSYLWLSRDSDGDGCLETWCKYDTGEDHAMRYGNAPDAWEDEMPPQGYEYVPIASIDFMSYSYSAREYLAIISKLLSSDQKHQIWQERALCVKKKIRSYLWSEEKGACFDRDKTHEIMPVLTHNTLRAMYWNSISQDMADRFVTEHLLNPQEFWTKMPLPSVAVNDPLFRNVTTNNWSGQAEALTYQRAIRALENYGYFKLIPQLGRKLRTAIGESCRFVQQYDPFTMWPSIISLEGEQDAYGPAMLSVMEYTARMYGVSLERDRLIWGTCADIDTSYEQIWDRHSYRIENNGGQAVAFIDGSEVFQAGADLRIVTDLSGGLIEVNCYSDQADPASVTTMRRRLDQRHDHQS